MGRRGRSTAVGRSARVLTCPREAERGTDLAFSRSRVSGASLAPEQSPARGELVPSRTFEDSTGVMWEVFEVHRSSQKAGAVSAGLEQGWLAFVSGDSKRRLAPFPNGWDTADSVELERLCGLARAARGTGPAQPRRGGVRAAPDVAPPSAPRIRPSRQAREVVVDGDVVIGESATSENPVERTVREFAREARARGLPAIGAMVRLKSLLGRVYPESTSPARDVRAVRRWFVESYYFERNDADPDGDGQSR